MKKTLFVALCAGLFIFTGCGPKQPKSFKSGTAMAINNAILEKQYNFVPKDSNLQALNFAYELFLSPQGQYMLANELVVKTFLLAHNSEKIIIMGKEPLISRYKAYFISNGVEAQIETQPIDNGGSVYETHVQVLFFNKKQAK